MFEIKVLSVTTERYLLLRVVINEGDDDRLPGLQAEGTRGHSDEELDKMTAPQRNIQISRYGDEPVSRGLAHKRERRAIHGKQSGAWKMFDAKNCTQR